MKDKKVGSVLKTETKVIAYVVICLVIIVLGISYALFFEVKGNEKNQIVKAGTLEFTYANGSQITNATKSDCFIPMNSEEALSHSECEYKISITNSGTLPGSYSINLNSETVDKPLALNKLKIILKKEGQVVTDYPKEGTTTSLVENEKIEAGKIINYSVQVYVDKELVDANDDEKNISIKINGDAVVNSEEVNPKMTLISYIKNLPKVTTGDGLYEVTHDVSEIGKEWNKTEYRYAGSNPNNYVSFNNEKWRIIGLVNVKVGDSIEQRVKIVRSESIDKKASNSEGSTQWYKDIHANNWTSSTLMQYLNEEYYNTLYDDATKNMIDKNITWNIGGATGYPDIANLNVLQFYEKERGTKTGSVNTYPAEWSASNTEGATFHSIALVYPSDYGYATSGGNECYEKNLGSEWNLEENSNCPDNNWIKPIKTSSEWYWTLTPDSSTHDGAFIIMPDGRLGRTVVTYYRATVPSLYLKTNINIIPSFHPELEYGSQDNPFVLE